ncbi:MAG: Rieske 2Fe-2S domain-containing protein [Pseudomonadota bacterium]
MQAEAAATWVPAAVGADVLDGTVVPAMLPTGPIAVWRTQSGRLSANADRCPHRGMRLSHGFVRGETLSCIYHGWRFGRDGGCQYIPAHPKVVPPKSINCGPLPVMEQNGVIWVASAQPPQDPQVFEGYTALRSLVIAAPARAVWEVSGGMWEADAIITTLQGLKSRLLLSPRGSDDVFVIALIEAGAPLAARIAASSALEALRRRAEALDVQEACL